MGRRNSPKGSGCAKKRRLPDSLDQKEYCQPNQSPDGVEGQMNQSGPLGVFVGADRGEHRRDAGADILPHYNGNRRTIGNLPGYRQYL